MRVKEIKILPGVTQGDQVLITFQADFDELKEISLYSCQDLITTLEWNMNQARKELKSVAEAYRKELEKGS